MSFLSFTFLGGGGVVNLDCFKNSYLNLWSFKVKRHTSATKHIQLVGGSRDFEPGNTEGFA